MRLVLGRTVKLLALGILLGVPATLSVTWVSAASIFAVSGTDPLTCFAAVGLVVLVALAASLTPAWRAARLDFVAALRE